MASVRDKAADEPMSAFAADMRVMLLADASP